MLNNLFAKIGYADAVRASAYLVLGCLFIASFLVKPRIPGRKKRPAHMQFPAPNMKAIVTHNAYLLTIAGGFLIMWGICAFVFQAH
jgi:MCP family monocarboxylic acid transporter-like MFS transporter 10